VFTEILKVVPRIDAAAAAAMENRLTKRFAKVSKAFGKGLNMMMKGNILFLSAGFITSLLNPLEKIHDKIKDLLGQGADIEEFSAKLGINPKDLLKLQAVGQSLGVTPDRLREMLTKYAEAVEKAREQLGDPTSERSLSTMAIADLIDKDLALGFQEALKRIVERGSAPTARESSTPELTLQQAERAGLARDVSGAEQRRRLEKDLFGEETYGAARKLTEANITEILKSLGQPGLGMSRGSVSVSAGGETSEERGPGDILQRAIDNVREQGKLFNQEQAKYDLESFIKFGTNTDNRMVRGNFIEQVRGDEKLLKQMTNYEAMQKASQGLEEILKIMRELSALGTQLLGIIGNAIPDLKLWGSNLMKNVQSWFRK
jgi:hypothetical protein